MVIAFWSPNHGQTATTTTALTYASMTAVTNNYKVLLGHTHLSRSTLERCLIPKRAGRQDDLIAFNDTGMDALRRLAKNGRLFPEKVSNYTTPLLAGNRLDLLQGLAPNQNIDTQEESSVLRRIFTGAASAYDLVIIDVHSGSDKELTQMLLQDADVVVVCLNQNIWLLEDYFDNVDNHGIFPGKKVFYHLSSYTRESKYTMKNIGRLYGIENLIATPYCPELMDACSCGNALEFFMRHGDCGKKDRFYPVMKLVRESTEKFLSTLGGMATIMEEAEA